MMMRLTLFDVEPSLAMDVTDVTDATYAASSSVTTLSSVIGSSFILLSSPAKDQAPVGRPNNSASFLLHTFCAGSDVGAAKTAGAGGSRIDDVTAVIFTRVIVALAAFGLLGNALNLVVLTLRGRQCRGRMERFAYTGLTALALADGLFCLTVLPHGVTSYYQRFLFRSLSFDIVYGLCGVGLFNTCVTCSTWLTVMLASGRYLAVCHPVKARQVTSAKTARCAIVAIFVASVCINLPWYWMLQVKPLQCPDGSTVYALGKGPLRGGPNNRNLAYDVFTWTYYIAVVLAPLILLSYCNVFMIRALRRAVRQRSTFCAATTANNTVARTTGDSHQGTTLVLVLFIIMHSVFVAPAEVANFFRFLLPKDAATPRFNLVVACLNALQTTYFALNFVLYCAINAQFRHVVTDNFVRCQLLPPARTRTGPLSTDRADGTSSVRYSRVLVPSITAEAIPLKRMPSTKASAIGDSGALALKDVDGNSMLFTLTATQTTRSIK